MKAHQSILNFPEVKIHSLEEEPIFQAEIEDDSDILLDILVGHLASGSSMVPDGFMVAEKGKVERDLVAEDVDADFEAVTEDNPTVPELGRGRHTKKVAAILFQIWEM